VTTITPALPTSNGAVTLGAEFLPTKEHRRFVEFADACRRHRYIGICHGSPGVGKTASARHYADWDELEPWLPHRFDREHHPPPRVLERARTALWTPTVIASPRQLEDQIRSITTAISNAVEDLHRHEDEWIRYQPGIPHCELLIVDEADRLKTTGLEQLRDFFDRHQLGLILIGMPGLEKRLARYPQLYSRIGFAHRYQPLSTNELRFVLAHHWHRLGLTLDLEDFTDAEAISAIARITTGNFRLIHRLLAQTERILEINHLHTITAEVVDAARETLVIGAT
jgi:DNA transposition AAA+ family ATPase